MLETYRGAAIYEVNPTSMSEDQLLMYKVRAEGLLPEPDNLKVDFTEEAQNSEQALQQIKERIDQYLDKHEIEKFVHERSEQ